MNHDVKSDVLRLKRYHDLKRLTKSIQDEIWRLNQEIGSYNFRLTGMPRGTDMRDKVAETALKLVHARTQLEGSMCEADAEYARLTRYMTDIEDVQIRNIMYLRYVREYTWREIANAMGETDESYPRKRHNAYLQKYPIGKLAVFAETSKV